MKTKRVVFFSIIITILMINSVTFGLSKTLNLALYIYPPLQYKRDGDWGYCYKLVKAIFEKKGYQLKPRLYPTIRAIKSTEDLKSDALCSINPFNSKRLSHAIYANARLTYFFWVLKDSTFHYKGIESLKGIKVINIRGYNYTLPGIEYQKYLENDANEINIRLLSGEAPLGRAFKMIRRKRADTICLDEPSAVFTLMQDKVLKNFKKSGHLPNVLYAYFSVSKNHPQKDTLLKIYNEGHIEMVKNKKFAKILSEFNIEPWPLSDGKR